MPKNNIGRTPQGTSRRRGQGNNEQVGDDTLVDLVEVRDQAQGFIDSNRNTIIGAAFILAGLVFGYFLYQALYKAPRAERAVAELQQAEVQFGRDSFQLALANPGINASGQSALGLLDIIDDYGNTPAGNLANYYAGVSYLNLGEYAAALDYIKAFKPNGSITPTTKYGVMGDAESELGNYSSAISHYENAVEAAGENFSLGGYYLNKLALLLRNQGQNDAALAAFNRLKTEFGQAPEARDADLYIGLLQAQ